MQNCNRFNLTVASLMIEWNFLDEDFFWHINVSDWSQSRAFLTIYVQIHIQRIFLAYQCFRLEPV